MGLKVGARFIEPPEGAMNFTYKIMIGDVEEG
jgi:hypothetical protein